MNSSRLYYKDIDFIRVLACIAVLLYHLNILKGGYLAVCVFFVLSGYLSCTSMFKKEKISLVSYYTNRLKKIYIPLIVVVFITIMIVSFFSNINWFNLKPETTSVLFGYNNYWQLNANMDYFARHINSPFVHLWYISILLQFDLVFPFIYYLLKKIGDKVNRIIPCIVLFMISVIFSVYFYKASLTGNVMLTYYSTETRIFSLLFGVTLGFIKHYYGILIPSFLQKNIISRAIFYLYNLLIIFLFLFVDAKSIYYPFSMIFITLITCRLINYGTLIVKEKLTIFNKFIRFLSGISYEVYLIQYPVIFLFQYISIDSFFKLFIMTLLIIFISYILHLFLNNKNINLKYSLSVIILPICLYGGYSYYMAEDHTKEMKQLENQLADNQEIVNKKQEEFILKSKQEEENLLNALKELEDGEEKLKEAISKLSIIGVGDSVMLGAVNNLYNQFPNAYIDAQVSRTAWSANGILQSLNKKNMLGEIIVFNLGANGDCSYECKVKIMETCGKRDVFWINVTNDRDVHVNDELVLLSNDYSNLHIIDWNSISKGHREYFISDGIHLTKTGREAYVNTIYDSIYKVYLDKYTEEKENILKEYEEKQNSKITFYGNDILLTAFSYLETYFVDSKFNINEEYNYETLKIEIEKSIKEKTLTKKIVFAFDDNIDLSKHQYNELIDLCKEYELFIVATSKKVLNNLSDINYETVKIIDFYSQIIKNENYLMADGIHLTEEGNKAISSLLNNIINEN